MAQKTVKDVLSEVDGYLQSIATIANKIVHVYSNEDLANKITGLKVYPGVGLVYEGMRSVPVAGSSEQIGISSEMVISIILIMQPETLFRADAKTEVIDLLENIRSKMLGRRSSTGHKWKFLVEAPAEVSKGMAFWVQRWAVPIQLQPFIG